MFVNFFSFYHITSRGDRREDIYKNDRDHQSFLQLLGQVCINQINQRPDPVRRPRAHRNHDRPNNPNPQKRPVLDYALSAQCA